MILAELDRLLVDMRRLVAELAELRKPARLAIVARRLGWPADRIARAVALAIELGQAALDNELVRLPAPDEPRPTVGERLAKIRRYRGARQVDIAGSAGVGQGRLSQYERGILAPSLPTFRRICAALGIEPADVWP